MQSSWLRRKRSGGIGRPQTLEEATAAYARGDYAAAFELFHALAEQGEAVAQTGLGFMYEKGRGVVQDDVEAMRWYRQAAEQGFAGVQGNLGVMYEAGREVAQAHKWYNIPLSLIYKHKANAQNYVQAHKWYNLAASRSSGPERERYVRARDEVASEMTPAQVAEAHKLAREWRPRPAPTR